MNAELAKGYQNFLLTSIRTYFLGLHTIQQEINFITNNELNDGIIFFLYAFDKFNLKTLKSLKYENIQSLNEYLHFNEKGEFIDLKPKGIALKIHLETKLKSQTSMLEFNGITPKDIAKATTTLRRFEKFWLMICMLDKKKSMIATKK